MVLFTVVSLGPAKGLPQSRPCWFLVGHSQKGTHTLSCHSFMEPSALLLGSMKFIPTLPPIFNKELC